MVTFAGKDILKPAKFYPLRLWKEKKQNKQNKKEIIMECKRSSDLGVHIREKSTHGESHLPTRSWCSI